MRSPLEALSERPTWAVFALLVVAVSLYQLYIGQTMSGAFGILVAVVLLLSVIFQPPGRPD